MQSEFQAFVSDETSYATAYGWAERQGFSSSSVQRGGPEMLLQHLEVNMPAKLLVVDVDGVADAVTVLGKLALRCGSATKLVALGAANDVGLYRQFLSAGVADYLVKPLTPEQLSQTMALILRGDAAAGGNGVRDAKVVVFVGVRGGVGASTLAVNTAWLMAHEMKKQTALIDLDMQFGVSALALDLEPGRGMRDLVSSPQRVDSLMISGSSVQVDDHFSVISAEEVIDEQVAIDSNAVTTLLKEMRGANDAIIVELPRHMLATQKRLLTVAHEIVLVSELSLVGIRDTLRIRTMLKSLSCPARVTLIATRVGPTRPAQVEEATFAKGAQGRIDFIMPEEYKTVTTASNSGKSFVAMFPNSPLTKEVRNLADYLIADADEEEKPKKGGLFGRLFKKKSNAEDEL